MEFLRRSEKRAAMHYCRFWILAIVFHYCHYSTFADVSNSNLHTTLSYRFEDQLASLIQRPSRNGLIGQSHATFHFRCNPGFVSRIYFAEQTFHFGHCKTKCLLANWKLEEVLCSLSACTTSPTGPEREKELVHLKSCLRIKPPFW
jgi:hypothetical protein